MGVGASGATLEIQLVADVARLKRDMAAMQDAVGSATASATKSFAGLSAQTVNSAAQMAAAAQASARAAVTMGTGLKSAGISAANARIVTLEMFHVTRSLTEQLATGVNPARAFAMEMGRIATAVQYSGGNIKGLIRQFAEWAGIITVTRNAELAEAAAQKATVAEAIKSRAERAAATLQAREVDVALAQAQLATAASADAEAAAQARLVKALRAVEVAAGRATIAQEALSTANAEAAASAEASNAKTAIALSARGALLLGSLTGVTIAGLGAVAMFKDLQAQVRDSGVLDRYANSLGLTKKEMKELRQEVGGLSSKEMKDLDARMAAFQLTWGDVFNGLKKTASDALDLSPAWQRFTAGTRSAFEAALKHAVAFAAGSYGVVVGAYDTIVDTWGGLANAIGHAFVSAVNAAIAELNRLMKASVDGINGLIDQANKLPLVNLSHLGAPQIAAINDSYAKAGAGAGKSFAQHVAEETAHAQGEIARNVSTIWNNIIGAAEERIRKAAATIIEDRTPKRERHRKQGDHGLAEALAELDAQIRGQWRLAAAYLISDAAAIKATALQKAEEEAIRHKGSVGIFYEKELAKAVATGAAEGAKQIAHVRDENEARRAVNDNLANGTLSYRNMNEAMQDQTGLQPLLALQTLATGDAYKRITEIIELYRRELQSAHEEEHRSQALQELGRLSEQHQETMKLLEQESQLTGVQKDKRDEILKLLKQEMELRQQFPGMTQEEINKVVAETAAEDTLRKHLDQVEAGMDQLRQTGENMIDTVFNIDNWKDPLDLALQLVKQLEQSFVTLGFANPLKNMLYGENLPTLDSVGGVGGFFSKLAGGGKDATALLSTAGTSLGTAGTTLNTAAIALQGAATALSAAAAASGAGSAASGAGGILGLLGGLGGGGGFLATGMGADIGGIGGDASLLYDSAALGLADGGAFTVGGRGGTDKNVLSINGKARARVSADEIIAVIPKDQFGGGGHLPGMKDGGFLKALGFLSPGLFLQQHHLLKFLSPAAFLFDQIHGEGGGLAALKFLSPAAMAGSALFGGKGDKDGHTFNINVHAPSTGNAAQDRQTSLQQAADIRMAVAGAASKGLI
jgi:hypothetical protein